MKALFLLVNPSDRPAFDEDVLWDQLTDAINPIGSGAWVLDRLPQATEIALTDFLSRNQCDVVHVITHCEEKASAAYGTVALLASDRRSRYLSAKHFADLLCGFPSLRLVVLQAFEHQEHPFQTVSETLLERHFPAVVLAPFFHGRSERLFAEELYRGLAAGASAAQLAQRFTSLAKNDEHAALSHVEMYTANQDAAIIPGLSPQMKKVPEPVSVTSPASPSAPTAPSSFAAAELDPEQLLEELRVRKAGVFDVFLSYNSEDRALVKKLAVQLMQRGILPWLDDWELPPGQLWQPALTAQLHNIRAAAVCIGASAIRTWQEHEINTLMIEFFDRKAPVIPVLLPNAPANPVVPGFLRTMSWVDFRKDDPPPLERLIWGITGKHYVAKRSP